MGYRYLTEALAPSGVEANVCYTLISQCNPYTEDLEEYLV